MSETVLRSGPSRGTAYSAAIGGIVKGLLVAAMREQTSIFISIEACQADVFQYCVVRPQQIPGLAAVAMSLDKNFGHLRENPNLMRLRWPIGARTAESTWIILTPEFWLSPIG